VVFSGLTVLTWPEDFLKNDSPVDSYAFPLFITGTTLLTAGMFWCAFLIESASAKYKLSLESNEEIFWLQPGDQEVADQVVEAFTAVSRRPGSQSTEGFEYIKSVRMSRKQTQLEPLVGAVAITVMGFVLQFVGLRGLHASVTLAQLGSTLVMSAIRAALRTQRMSTMDNLLLYNSDGNEMNFELSAYKDHELEWLTFYLHNIRSFQVMATSDDRYAIFGVVQLAVEANGP
jgi:ankyrin repeat domain-containing protein 50